MSSYFNRRTIGSSDPSRHHMDSECHGIGGRTQFAAVDTPHQRGKGHQDQDQSFQSSVRPQRFVGHEHDSIDGATIPPPSGHAYRHPFFHCPRCGHPFGSQAELDCHSFFCGAAALLTGMFIPWSAPLNDQFQQPQLHLQPPHDAGNYHEPQHPDHNRNRST